MEYIDETGKVVIQRDTEAFAAGEFSEGLAPFAYEKGRFGYIDKSGQFVIKPQFEEACQFSGGLARVKDDGKYGFIDKTGSLIVDLMFDDAGDFTDGIARVKLGSRIGYIDRTGRYVWKPSK